MNMPRLRRVRWAVRATLILGLAASTVGNILHANPNPISQTISAWPVAALYLTIELISRIPVHRRGLAFARLVAAAIIAGIAAWVSYWHMAGVAARYGETGASPYLLPLSVDGLIVVASICLVELGGRIRDAEQAAAASQPVIDVPTQSAATAPAAVAPVSAPPAPVAKDFSVAAEVDDAPGQEVRLDDRESQDIDLLVRAIKSANPNMPIRQVARLVQVSDTTVRRSLRRTAAVDESQQEATPINGNMPTLEDSPA